MLRYLAEMEFACFYALRNPALSKECALMARECALALERPDLVYNTGWFLQALAK